MWNLKKNGIALLITLLFVIAITASVGLGLKYINNASHEIEHEKFMLQTSVILNDVLTLLKTSKDLDAVTQASSPEALFMFLSQAAFIPFESSGVKVSLELKSARSKFNVNELVGNNATINQNRVDALKEYLDKYMVSPDYVDILRDGMSGIKEDMSYNSEIFYEKPQMFRDYITSANQLDVYNRFYTKKYHDNSLKNIKFDNLFCYNNNKTMKIDLNYATPEVWMLILGTDEQRAKDLASLGGTYTKVEDIGLQDDEKVRLAQFATSVYEPFIDVTVEVIQGTQDGKIHFEYDLVGKKGSNFVYEI